MSLQEYGAFSGSEGETGPTASMVCLRISGKGVSSRGPGMGEVEEEGMTEDIWLIKYM